MFRCWMTRSGCVLIDMPISQRVQKANTAGISLRMQRLKKRTDFLRTAKGRKAVRRTLVLQARKQSQTREPGVAAKGSKSGEKCDDRPHVRVGFTVTRRIGNAVRRNRVKRRLRAALHRQAQGTMQPGYDYVIIGRATTFNAPFQSLVDDLTSAIRFVHNVRNETH